MKKTFMIAAILALSLGLAGCYIPTTTTVIAATNFPTGSSDTFTATVKVDLGNYNLLSVNTLTTPTPQPQVCFYQEAHRETLLGCVKLTSSMVTGNIGTATLKTKALDTTKKTSYVIAVFSDPTGFFASSTSEKGAPLWY